MVWPDFNIYSLADFNIYSLADMIFWLIIWTEYHEIEWSCWKVREIKKVNRPGVLYFQIWNLQNCSQSHNPVFSVENLINFIEIIDFCH